MEKIVFLVRRADLPENVVVAAISREEATRAAHRILLGNPDDYLVDSITRYGSKTVILLVY